MMAGIGCMNGGLHIGDGGEHAQMGEGIETCLLQGSGVVVPYMSWFSLIVLHLAQALNIFIRT